VNVKRLSWAGVQLEAGGSSVVIDLFAEAEPVKPVMGEPAHPLVRVDDNSVQLALVTHVHANHYDPDGVSGGSRRTGSSGVARQARRSIRLGCGLSVAKKAPGSTP
jgi:L-ascorbate metabolism protein UlaG (beta-lactamase superfamily)